jgi:hypothetical protein
MGWIYVVEGMGQGTDLVNTVMNEECRLLEDKNPVHTSQETRNVSVTEPSPLMLCKI